MAYTIWNHKKSILCLSIRASAALCHFLTWMMMVVQLWRWLSRCFYVRICFLSTNKTENPQHLDCGRSIHVTHGDKTSPDSAEPRFESFYLPFIAGINLPHQGIVDKYIYIISNALVMEIQQSCIKPSIWPSYVNIVSCYTSICQPHH